MVKQADGVAESNASDLDTRSEFEIDAPRRADQYLSKASEAATRADVFGDTVAVTGEHPTRGSSPRPNDGTAT